MELRVLQYFLAVTREQSISGAAESLHLSQPTLSRQLKELEEELGRQLFIRGNRRITLTEEGMILRRRAEEILELVKKAEHEVSLSDETLAGDITIGAGETDGVRLLANAAQMIQKEYPLVHFHIVSGDRVTVTEEMDRGLIDFGLLFGRIDPSNMSPYRSPAKTGSASSCGGTPLWRKKRRSHRKICGRSLSSCPGRRSRIPVFRLFSETTVKS